MKNRSIKKDNKGFTLIEVLVGIIILAIMSAPIYRAFATSAQTNSKATIKAKCTTAAENLMEEYKALSAEDLEEKIKEYEALADPGVAYAPDKCGAKGCGADLSGNYVCPSCGSISIRIPDNAELNADLPNGYYGEVILNTKSFEETNSLNVSEFGSVSPKNAAIYTSESKLDEEAVTTFLRRNQEYCSKYSGNKYYDVDEFKNSGMLVEDTNETIRKNLDKDVTITITELDRKTDSVGEEYSIAKVSITIKYTCNALKAVANTKQDKEFKAEEAYLFNNTGTTRKLDGVYYFFEQRRGVGEAGSTSKENITVLNPKNVATNVYVVSTGMADKDYLKEVNVLIKEKELVDGKASALLRTNLLEVNKYNDRRTPYSKKDTKDYGVLSKISYATNASTYGGDDAVNYLDLSDIDGKKLKSDNQNIRIYKLYVNIYDNNDKVVAYLDGSKLND